MVSGTLSQCCAKGGAMGARETNKEQTFDGVEVRQRLAQDHRAQARATNHASCHAKRGDFMSGFDVHIAQLLRGSTQETQKPNFANDTA